VQITTGCARTALALLTVALVTLPAPVAAAPGAEFALTVSPSRLVVEPGQAGDDQHFEVSNGGSAPVQVVVSKRDFAAGQDGTMAMTQNAPYSASNWISVRPGRFALAAGATVRVAVRITVPAAPEPGDHQVALVFLVPSDGTGANIRLNRGIGAPVFITVPGAVDDSTEIAALHAPRFALRGRPVTFTATIRDSGTVHRDFRAGQRLTIGVDGQQVHLPEFTVLRGSDRVVTSTWRDTPTWCSCRAVLSMTRADGTVQHSTVKILIMPVHLILIALAAILVLLAGAWLIRRRYRAQVLYAARTLHPAEDGD